MRAGQILYELDRWDEEEVPEELLLAAVEEKEEITPDLIAAVEDAAKIPQPWPTIPRTNCITGPFISSRSSTPPQPSPKKILIYEIFR